MARVEPLVDERTRSFRVVVEVPGRAGLVGGLFARASVRVGQVEGALVVPPAALVRDGSDPAGPRSSWCAAGKAEKQAIGARGRVRGRRAGARRPRGGRRGRARPADRPLLGRAGPGRNERARARPGAKPRRGSRGSPCS